MARFRVLAIVVATFGCVACAGYHSPPGPVIADRPGYTDAPNVLPAGAPQIELGYTTDKVDGVRYRTFGELLLRVGVGGSTEARIFANSFAKRSITGLPDDSGLEDPKLGIKASLFTKPDSVHGALPNVSFLAASTLPVGAAGFGSVHAQPEAKLAMNWTTASPLSVYSNAGVGGVFDGSSWGQRGWVSVAVWYAANPKVSLFGEGLTTRRLGGSVLSTNNVDAGITYLINARFQVDLRVGRGLGDVASGERFFGAGLARRW
jgi:hypothetical protein